MKIKSSSTQMFFGSRGGGIGSHFRGSSRRQLGGISKASYGASGFGIGGSARAGKGRKSPTPASPPPSRPPRRP